MEALSFVFRHTRPARTWPNPGITPATHGPHFTDLGLKQELSFRTFPVHMPEAE